MPATHKPHFHQWLQSCIRQYCLASSWDIQKTPLELAIFFSKAEILLRETSGSISLALPGKDVTIFDLQMKNESTITLVSPDDSDPKNGKISYFSPLGSRLLGCKAGDIVEVKIFSRKEIFYVTNIKP
jgi:hypothetical protein